MVQQTVKLLTYTGKAQDFPIWSTRFVAMMQTKGLYKSILGTKEQPHEPAPLANGACNDERKDHKVLKDAYEKEVEELKEKRNNVLCRLALTLDATTLMLMRHDCVGDDGSHRRWRWRKGLEAFAREISVWRQQQCWLWWNSLLDFRSRILRIWIASSSMTGVAHKATRSRGNILRDLLQRLGPQWSANEVWKFVIQKSFNTATNSTELRKRLQNFHESTTQRHKGQSGSVALAVKRNFNKGPKNPFVCGIPGHFAKDCRRKDTEQCSKCGEKGHLDKACRRQRDGGKHESVAMGLTLASPDEEHWAALTQWKTAVMLVDRGCTDHIVTNIDIFSDFVPMQSMVRNPNGQASRVVGRGRARISIPSNKWEFQCERKNILCVPEYSSNLLSISRCTDWGHSFTFEKKNSCMKLQTGTRVKPTQESNLFYLPCSVLEFKMSSKSVKQLFTDVRGPFRVELLSRFWFYIVSANLCTTIVFVDLLKANSGALPSLNKFVLSAGDAQETATRQCKEVLLRAIQAVLFRCRHSTGEDHTTDATAEWVSWEVQQDTAGDGKILALWLGSIQDDVGSSNFPRNKVHNDWDQ